MASKGKKKPLTAEEKMALEKRRRTIMMGVVAGIIVIVLMAISIFGYTSYAKNDRQMATQDGIVAISQGNFQEAIRLLKYADSKGETYASEFLAWLYINAGHYKSAEEYANRAVHFNRLSAYEVLGDLALLNIGEKKGVRAALAYFKQGSIALASDQAKRIQSGEQAIRPHPTTAWHKRGAQNLTLNDVSARATNLFSQMVDRGLHLVSSSTDYSELVMGAVRLGAKDLDMPLGDMLFLGTDGVASNIEVAKKHWQAALDKGNQKALLRLAGVAWHGYAQDRSPQEAIDLYSAAAEQHNDPVAYYALGLINLRLPNANIQSNRQAVEYFTKASALGYGPASTALGVLAMTETNSEVSAIRAAQWLRIAAEEQKDIPGRVLYDLMLMSGVGVPLKFTSGFDDLAAISYSFKPAESIIDLLQKRIEPIDVLKQAMILSNQVLHGEIAWREGDPVSITEIYDKATGEWLPRPFTFYKSVKTVDNITKSRFGANNFCPVTDFSKLTIDGKPLMHEDLAKIILQYAPSTGAHQFVPELRMPRPFPPMVPLHYEIGDFVPPVNLVKNVPYIDPHTEQPSRIF